MNLVLVRLGQELYKVSMRFDIVKNHQSALVGEFFIDMRHAVVELLGCACPCVGEFLKLVAESNVSIEPQDKIVRSACPRRTTRTSMGIIGCQTGLARARDALDQGNRFVCKTFAQLGQRFGTTGKIFGKKGQPYGVGSTILRCFFGIVGGLVAHVLGIVG